MQHIVDEFGDLTAQIARLKKRREALRQSLLEPAAPLRSNRYEVKVRYQERRVLEKSLLPKEILDDPSYYRITRSPVVSVKALGDEPRNEDDVVLIE